MKRKLRLLMSMLLLAVMGSAWADVTNVTASKVTNASVTWTGSGNETWSVVVVGGATNQNVTNSYAQVGTRNSPSTSITFSTSGISGTITSVVVDCASYSGIGTVDVTVGGSDFGTQEQPIPQWSSNTGGEVSFTGSASGAIVITMTNGTNGRAMYIKGITVTYSNGGQTVETVATPTFSPIGGTYYETQSVSLLCATDGATIYYTTDGSTPTTSSSVYSSAIPVSATTTIKAIAVKSGMNNSNVATATYTIQVPIDPTVSFATDPASVRVGNTFTNTINKPNDLTVTYSVTSGSQYATVDATTGEVTGVAEGQAIITASWNAVEHTYNAGSVSYTINVNAPSGTVIYEKITSTDDLTTGNYLIVYEDGGLAFNGSLSTLDASGNTSAVTINNNVIETDEDIYFTIDVDNGNTIMSASGNYIGRTTNSNGMNVNASTAYTNSISFDNGNANIVGSGGAYLRYNATSGQERFRYYSSSSYTNQKAIQLYKEKLSNAVATPKFNPESGTYNETQSVTITTTTEGATIYYTTDGSDPATSSTREEYTGAVTVDNSMTVRAIAVKDDNSSSEATAEYVLQVATPVFDPTPKTYAEAQSVTITCATQGATIYYTTDGTDPTTSSTPYTGAISVTETTTIKAIAVNGVWVDSEVATANYTINANAGTNFVKALYEDDLSEGMEVIIVYETDNVAMGEQRNNNFGQTSIVIDTDASPYEAIVEDESTAAILTLEGGTGAWYFKTTDGKYLCAASSSSNHLKTRDDMDDNAKASMSFEDGDVTIQFQGSYSRNLLRYNSTDDLFACYGSGQNLVQIYYRGTASSVKAPTILPVSGTYAEAQTVTITNNAEGTTLYYTTDGTTPTNESTVYTSPFEIGKNGTYIVKAISIGEDGQSRVTTSTITIDINPVPVFTEESGTTFDASYTIHLTAPAGATIYYTTGSASPLDEDGNLSSSAIAYPSTGIANLSNAVTINAIAIDQYGNVSSIATASYKYIGEVTLPYYENFDEGLGNFTTYPTSTGTNDVKWEFATTSEDDIEIYGEIRKYARIKGGTTSTTSGNAYPKFIGEDYLVSPVIDMRNVTSATLNFIHGGHYFGTGYDTNTDGTDNLDAKKASCKLYVRDVTNGVPTDVATGWIDKTDEISNWFYQQQSSNGGLFPRVNSGDISLNDYVGRKVQIAFYFTTDATMSGYWNVLKFAVTGTEADQENFEEVNMTTDGYITYVVQNDIDWQGMRAKDNTDDKISVYGYKVIEYSLKQKAAVLVEFGFGGEDTSTPTYSENIIPANTPIVLKGCQGTNNLLIAKSHDVIPAVKGNLLKPSFGDVTVSEDQAFYVLQKQSGWTESDPYNNYWFNRLKTGRTIPERKAYLNGLDMVDELVHVTDLDPGYDDPGFQGTTAFYILRPAPSAVVSDDAGIVDGIETIEKSHMSDNEFYTISGVRVDRPSKGLYIMNGKKVIIK